jgi:microcystin-dependent protein
MNKGISKITIALIVSLVVIGILFAQEIGIIVIPNGNVCIGTENPTAALEVNGRIKDKTGFIMPVGTILPYGGDTAPDGWLLCDGTSYDGSSGSEYEELFNAIGITFGGSGATFNVPDLRGIFMRGAGTNEKLSRANGTSFSGTLGAYQNDKFQGHIQKVTINGSGFSKTNFGAAGTEKTIIYNQFDHTRTADFLDDGTNGTPRTGAETNPANVAVNYMIKY